MGWQLGTGWKVRKGCMSGKEELQNKEKLGLGLMIFREVQWGWD